MRFQNETTDQALCLTRKHPFGDEPNANKVLLPGDSYECAGIYQVEQSYRALTDEEQAIVNGNNIADGAATREAATDEQPPVNLQQHIEMEKAAQQEAKTNELPPASGSTEAEKAGASADVVRTEQVTESPAVADGVDTSPAPVVGDGTAAAAAEPVAAGDVAELEAQPA